MPRWHVPWLRPPLKRTIRKKQRLYRKAKQLQTHEKTKTEKPTKITADWLKNAGLTEVVSQLGIADDIFSAGESHKSRQEAFTLASWVI